MPQISWTRHKSSNSDESKASATDARFGASLDCMIFRAARRPIGGLMEVGVLGAWILRCVGRIPTHRSAQDLSVTLGLQEMLIKRTLAELQFSGFIVLRDGVLALAQKGKDLLKQLDEQDDDPTPASRMFVWIVSAARGFEVFDGAEASDLGEPNNSFDRDIEAATKWIERTVADSQASDSQWNVAFVARRQLAFELQIPIHSGAKPSVTCKEFPRASQSVNEVVSAKEVRSLRSSM